MPDACQVLRQICCDAIQDRATLSALQELNRQLFVEGNVSRCVVLIQQTTSKLASRKGTKQLCSSLGVIKTKEQAMKYLFPVLRDLPQLPGSGEGDGITNPRMQQAIDKLDAPLALSHEESSLSTNLQFDARLTFDDDILGTSKIEQPQDRPATGTFNVLQQRENSALNAKTEFKQTRFGSAGSKEGGTPAQLKQSLSLNDVMDFPQPADTVSTGFKLKKSPSLPRYMQPPSRKHAEKVVLKSRQQQFDEMQRELMEKRRLQREGTSRLLGTQTAPKKTLACRDALIQVLRELVTERDEILLKVSPGAFLTFYDQVRTLTETQDFAAFAQGFSLKDFMLIVFPATRQETVDFIKPALTCCFGNQGLDRAMIEAALGYIAESYVPQNQQSPNLVIPRLTNGLFEVPAVLLKDCGL